MVKIKYGYDENGKQRSYGIYAFGLWFQWRSFETEELFFACSFRETILF